MQLTLRSVKRTSGYAGRASVSTELLARLETVSAPKLPSIRFFHRLLVPQAPVCG